MSSERQNWLIHACLALCSLMVLGLVLSHGATYQLTWRVSSLIIRAQLNGTADLETVLRQAAAFAPPHMPQTVVCAEVNAGFLPLALNMRKSVQALHPPLRNFMWVALDAIALNGLHMNASDMLTYYDPTYHFTSNSTEFRTDSYNAIVKHKWILAQKILRHGFNVLIVDVDLVFLSNPFIHFQGQAFCDLTMYYDEPVPMIAGQSARTARLIDANLNTGFMLLKSSRNMRALLQAFVEAPLTTQQQKLDDQALFNSFLAALNDTSLSRPLTEFTLDESCWPNHNVSIRILSPVLFGSWRHYFHYLRDWTHLTPVVVHFNWLSGFDAKKSKMQEHGLWELE